MRTYRVGIAGFAAALLILFMAGCGQEVVNVPTVISTVAAQGATGVAVNTAVSATFSEAMNPATLNATTFTVTGPGGVTVPGAVTYGGITAIFTPATALAYGTLYTGTITTGASTPGGACLMANYAWTFTTITPAPVVAAVATANGATGVPINQVLSATFSEAMSPATLNATTFTVTGPGGVAVSGAVAYAGLVATFTPTINLAYNAIYTATITTGAEDLAGTGLTSNYVWSFTTITPAPTVTAVVPANGATGVPVNQVLSATFNETMSPATISTATFTVTGPGGVAVPGAVTYAGTVATFTPTISLANNAIYTATITTGAKDLAGTPLAANYVWTFTTITPAPAVTAVVPVNGATGVPIAQVLSATFNEAMSPATITAATFTVTGPGGVALPGAITYSGLVATFTPTASLAYSTTYTATITTGAEDLAGTPLAANYVWTFSTISPTPAVIVTIPVNGATGVPISQVLSATFNETMSCATLASPATTFTVTGPGTTAVAGTVSCAGSIATFTPSALLTVNTLYTATITTGAQDLAGTAMASNYVWSFLTLPAPTPPTVISAVPVNGATGVPINQAVSATFSLAMNAATIDLATFTLSAAGGASVTGIVTYVASGSTATFTPNASLASSTVYTATITTGAEDLAAVGLASNYVWTFTTAAAPILVPPTVISTIPANGATNVPFNQAISATFSTAMNPATISSSTFTLTGPGTTPVSGLVAYAAIGNTLTFIPSANLAPGTLFTATITTGAQDLAGTALASNYVWTFTTGAAPTVTPPEVVSTVPANAATGVALNQAVSATFTEAMNPLTIITATFLLTGPGGIAVAGTLSYDAINFIATFTPTTALSASTTYTATVTTGATDLAGDPLGTTGAPNPWSFTTGAAAIPPAPVVTAVVPANGATGVPINQVLSATFTEAMSCATLTSTTFTVTGPGATAVAGTVSCAGNIATFTPTISLANNAIYTATITTGAEDLAGTPLAANYVWSFTTITPAPTVTAVVPVNGATGVPIAQVLSATFSETMSPATISVTTFTVTGPGGTTVSGAVTYAGLVATFTPTVSLAYNAIYTATITTGAKDPAGTPLVANYVWTFTTAVQPTVISTVPANGATGVPVNQVLSATFSEAMSCATLTSPATSFTVTGPGTTSVAGAVGCTGAVATFTPTANLAYNTLYTATITTAATDTAGDPLAGNYVWTFTTAVQPTVISTVPANGAIGVSIAQVLSATFSKAMSCATLTSPATSFTVTGPGVTAVAGAVGCTGAVATFTPTANLAYNTLYTATITTAATDTAGDPLAGSYVWTFTTSAAPTSPMVIATDPANGATGMPTSQAITATFNEAMNSTTLASPATSFTVTGPGTTPVAGAVTYVAAGSVAIFTPSSPLAIDTVFTATITTAATDLSGNALASNYVWTFTTAAAPDTTMPTVTATDPVSGATSVPLNQAISATFSKAINPARINSATFSLAAPGPTPVVGQVAYAIGDTLIFTPAANLAIDTVFTATITTGATDLSGNALAANYVWTFTTGTAPDTTPPEISLNVPINGATNVALNQVISATFTEAMNPPTFTTFPTATNPTFQVTGPGSTLVAGTMSYDPINFIATFTPAVALTADSPYIATVTTGATDLAGNPLGNAPVNSAMNPWTFTTGTTSLVIPPPVNLGTAALFGAFSGTGGITNSGTSTVINGDIGTTGGSATIIDFQDNAGCVYTGTGGLVNGTIDTAPPPPPAPCTTSEGNSATYAIAEAAAADALTAYNQLVAFPNGLDVSVCPGCGGGSPGELGSRTLAPGIYKSVPGTYGITVGTLTLDAQGDPNAFWVFQMATTLTVGTSTANESVILVNGAQAKNVYWQVGSNATINAPGGGTMVGTIITDTGAIAVSTAGVPPITTINGRLLALGAAVTMVNTVINIP